MADPLDALMDTFESRMDDATRGMEIFRDMTCFECKREIKVEEEALRAMGQLYHVGCLVCHKCKCVLFVSTYDGAGAMEKVKVTKLTRQNETSARTLINSHGIPWCEVCYKLEFANKCEHCYKPIADGDDRVQALSRNYHKAHFLCAKCATPLAGERHYIRDGKHVCGKCSATFV